MKIYVLPVSSKFKPSKQPFKYPPHNDDYGVEQDFYLYLKKNQDFITDKPLEADWHYLPVFWTRWHLNHNYGKEGKEELGHEINKAIQDESKTFTICQYDDGPLIDLGQTTQFLASRKDKVNIDIPLLSTPHKHLFFKRKKYLASFVGRLSTSPYRQEMAFQLKNRKDVLIDDGVKGSRFFINKTMSSYISLCPRGYGGSSFRLYEAMQLGVVPFLIGDVDSRPFKKWIDWDRFSFYSDNCSEIEHILDSVNHKKLKEMGVAAFKCYQEKLAYQKWCAHVLNSLQEIK